MTSSAEQPGWQVARLDLPPGEYGYLILEDGAHRIDPHNPLTTFWREEDDLEVSLLRIAECAEPEIVVDSVAAAKSGEWTAVGRFLAAEDGALPGAGARAGADATGAAGDLLRG